MDEGLTRVLLWEMDAPWSLICKFKYLHVWVFQDILNKLYLSSSSKLLCSSCSYILFSYLLIFLRIIYTL